MIKVKKGTLMAVGTIGELLEEYSEITEAIYERLKKLTDEEFAKEQLDLAHKLGFMSEEERIAILKQRTENLIKRNGERS